MKRTFLAFALCAAMVPSGLGAGPLRVVAAYPYIGDLVERLGGSDVKVFTLARGDYNPHVIIPRPSFIARLREADLLILNGAQLEIGWMPPLLRQASNPAIQTGEPGFLDLSRSVTLIDVPTSVSREHGDVHPEGNPHFYLDPGNVLPLARAITERLAQLDAPNASAYEKRFAEFSASWEARLAGWGEKMAPLRGQRVVEYHRVFDCFLRSYGLQIAGTVEPLPGIPPTSRHLDQLESALRAAPARLILQDVYNPNDASRLLSEKLRMKCVVLPHDVGAVKEADSIFTLFDVLVRRVSE